MVRGQSWECGWCGDAGWLPAQESVTIPLRVPVVDNTPPPRRYTAAELAERIACWDLDETPQACRDLLLAVFPAAARARSEEELQALAAADLIEEAAETDPETAVRMMQLLLDTAEPQLHRPETAEQLLDDELYGLCCCTTAQPTLLDHLAREERLRRQLFGSAFVGGAQEALLDACDWLGETTLKAQLQAILRENPHRRA